jgi:hypothetical protein
MISVDEDLRFPATPLTQFSVPVLFKGRKRGETTALGKELDFRGEN